MKRPGAAFALALVSSILSPILVFIELSALFFAGMVTYEPTNSLVVKASSIAVVVLIGLLALALPLIAITTGRRARAASRSMATGGSGLATAALVIGVIVTAGVLVAQVYFVLMVFGSCSLDGC